MRGQCSCVVYFLPMTVSRFLSTSGFVEHFQQPSLLFCLMTFASLPLWECRPLLCWFRFRALCSSLPSSLFLGQNSNNKVLELWYLGRAALSNLGFWFVFGIFVRALVARWHSCQVRYTSSSTTSSGKQHWPFLRRPPFLVVFPAV